MKFKLLHTMLFLSLCAVFAACSDKEEIVVDDPSGKTPIALSVGGVASQSATRVVTTGEGHNMNVFDKDAHIFMVMMSEYGTEDFDIPVAQRVPRYTIARGDVAKNDKTTVEGKQANLVTFDEKNQRYWDDAHARSSQLSIWAYAQVGKENWKTCTFQKRQTGTGWDAFTDEEVNTDQEGRGWTSEDAYYPGIKHWKSSIYNDNHQDETTVMCQDLLFSNNLANYDDGSHPLDDHRLKFDFVTRKFPTGDKTLMKFYHAMSKITIQLVAGDGFKATSTSNDFKFTQVASGCNNVRLLGFNNDGVFNIKTGQFEHVWPTSDADPSPKVIPQIYLKTTNKKPSPEIYYTLEALVVPNIQEFRAIHGQTDEYSRFVEGKKDYNTDVMMEFAVDNNKYQITSGDLYTALHGKTGVTEKTAGIIPLEAGKNYVFTFIVGKTKIKNITAQVAEWEEITADNITPTNARIKLQLEERGDNLTDNVAFYKAEDNKSTDGIDDNYETYNWKSGYQDLAATYGSGHWTTNSYWESNKDFYHFRAVWPRYMTVTEDNVNGDYFNLVSESCNDEDDYDQIAWGAPMKEDAVNEVADGFKWDYEPTKYGFDGKKEKVEANPAEHQIYKAIGPTEDPVKLILFHMMSGVHFTINTDGAKTDRVILYNGEKRTKVELVGYYANGKVRLGTGLVNTDGTISTVASPYNVENRTLSLEQLADQEIFFSAVPQDLTNVKLYITTPDNNQYIVDLKDVKATTVDTNNISNPYGKDNTTNKYSIDRWYPGFKYNYSFTLAKTGITNLMATIVDWETVNEDDDEPVRIK